jgi:hypothetical protein
MLNGAIVRGKSHSGIAIGNRQPSPEGISTYAVSSGSGLYLPPSANETQGHSFLSSLSTFTLVALGRKLSTGTANSSPFIWRSNGSGNVAYGLGLAMIAGIQHARFQIAGTVLGVPINAEPATKFHRLVAVADGTLLRLYTDEGGYAETSYVAPSYQYDGTTARTLHAGWSNSNGGGDAARQVVMGAVLAQAASDKQAESLLSNPWSLFASRRIPIPAPAAAATAPTITALSARLITATSAQPQITYA